MSLRLFRPFAFESFFENDDAASPLAKRAKNHPIALDVHENKDNFTVSAEVAGVPSDQIEISTEDNILTIKVERKNEKVEKDEEGRIVWSERSYGSFSRSIQLPDHIDKDNIQASQNDGVLEIILPKETKPKSKIQNIPINKKISN